MKVFLHNLFSQFAKKPLATKRALYLSISPLELYLILNTHLQPTLFLFFGLSIISHVLFLI